MTNYVNPTQFKLEIDRFINFMESKKNYNKSSTNQPSAPDPITSGKDLFNINIINGNKYKIDLTYINQILQSKLSEQEKAHYKLLKFILEESNNEYINADQIIDIYEKNYEHIVRLLKIPAPSGKTKKLVLYVPTRQKDKSNFWISLFFKKFLEKKGVIIDYMIDTMNRVSSTDIQNEFLNHDSQHYLVVICDDVSYSGQQLTLTTYEHLTFSPLKVNLFFNLLGYSDNAKKRLENAEKKSSVGTLIFGAGSKYPLLKISAKFNKDQTNNVLYLKAIKDNRVVATNPGTMAFVGLLLNDTFFVKNISTYGNPVCFSSQIYNLTEYYETKNIHDRNGSIQYLPFKYPDSLSTINNMCRLFRLENKIIFRVDRLIHYINRPDLSELEKLNFFADKLIKKNLVIDDSSKVYLNGNILNLFDFPSQSKNPDKIFPLDQNNQIDQKLSNTINNLMTQFDDGKNNETYNNMLFYKFINLNNKISKFNKKHLIELIPPLSNYTKTLTTKYIIKNCNTDPSNKTNSNSFNFCNKSCIKLSFYKNINWN